MQRVWEQEKCQSFGKFLRCYNNKDVVPTLEALQEMVEFTHNKGHEMLERGYAIPNVAKKCLHSSTGAKFFPFTDRDKKMLSKTCEDMVGAPSKAFTSKAVVDETDIRKSTSVCKSKVEIDPSQLYLYSMCQHTP